MLSGSRGARTHMTHPLAQELNETIASLNPELLEMLSERGRRFYFPKGIISQSAEAKAKAHRANATIGMATEDGQPMHLACLGQYFANLEPGEIYPYAPVGGRMELRMAWRDKMLADNPRLAGKPTSLPMVTSALTHGLCVAGELFVDSGDAVVLPDKLWGNYRLLFGERLGAEIRTFPFYSAAGGFNVDAFERELTESAQGRSKVVTVLNFPNNPTGYTPTVAEMEATAAALKRVADAGHRVVVVCDDAYFGMFYGDCSRESVFAYLAGLHPRVLPVRLDGATKELFAWGFRIGFITYALGATADEDSARLAEALEKKTMGVIRSTISSGSFLAQSILARVLGSDEWRGQQAAKCEVLCARAARVKQVLANPKYDRVWSYYPFNSGYFMCLRLKSADAEAVRCRVLDEHGVGTIAVNATDLRVAFSCLEEGEIEEVFDAIYAVASAE